MVIQSFCMAFYTNSELTFQVLQDKGILLPFFQAWVELLKGGKVKHDFELRKQLLGLCGIFRTDPDKIPAEVKQGLPGISKEFFTDLLHKMVDKRLEMIKAEQEDIDEQEKKLKGHKEKEEEDDEDEKEEEGEEAGDEGSDLESESDDGDFELEGGDMCLYDSGL